MKTPITGLYNSSNKMIVKSKGCYQYDSDGKAYIDFESGVWCANVGHNHDRMIRAIESQIKESIHHGYRFGNRQSEDLSQKLLQLAGFNTGSSVFLSSGSEAVNLAITIARHLTKRKKILRIEDTYLSAYGFGRISEENDSLVSVRFDDSKSIDNHNFTEISALVLETGGASIKPVQFPNGDFVKKLVETALQNNCHVIAEEVTTGMGRTGKWFGFQHYDIVPSMVVTGKGLGNGYPISAVTLDMRTTKALDSESIRYAQSHQNDPLGCAVAMETIKIVEDECLLERCNETGDYFKEKLERIQIKHLSKVKEVRARGLMLAIEFENGVEGEEIGKRLFDNGFIIGCKPNALRFIPPLVISQTDIDRMIRKLDELLGI
ncbi:MAG: aspartate aminotransferase family protein [Tannerella sp.]|jgi:acetylornithine aminotransferase|nr:aspartate aminotransferase family protein [Tannerella sp.]